MSGEYDVNVSTEALKAIEGIVADAYDRMETAATTIRNQGGQLALSYVGSGSAAGQENYENLAGAGTALSNALEGLKADLNITSEHGHETDQQAQQQMRGATGQGVYQGMRA
ncbi:WXG100 family type VII secretion target [Streptomyces oceani]|uniref:Uncharacterized protein n=1 Tax=Streptomyces oceani TaxID=1075402 RepID=A0A1E7JXK5_9ACTN|nr:hypothetical protein [Streptomyces oceani]OEU96386.1 hypothetical protein AN216_20505 [Streptomyces oceani]